MTENDICCPPPAAGGARTPGTAADGPELRAAALLGILSFLGWEEDDLRRAELTGYLNADRVLAMLERALR